MPPRSDWHRCCFFGLFFAATLAFPGVAQATMPDVLTTRSPHTDQTYPTWVSAKVASRPDGDLDPGLFHPQFLETFHNLLYAPVDPDMGCIPVGEGFESHIFTPDMSSLRTAFKAVQFVIHARIVDQDFGLRAGVPGQLLKVELIETFKGKDTLPSYYFFIPVGRFKAGKYEICKTDYRFPNIPRSGDEVVLLIPDQVAGDPLLDLTFENGLIVLRGDDVFLPEFKKTDKEADILSTRAGLLAELTQLAGGSK